MPAEYLGLVLNMSNEKKYKFSAQKKVETDFVQVELDEDRCILGQIIESHAHNRYLEKPEAISYIHYDNNILDSTVYIYTVVVLSMISCGKRKKNYYPVPPAARVFEADLYNICIALELESGEHEIGRLLRKPYPSVRVNLESVFSPHITVLGRTGSGKSYFTRNLLGLIRDMRLIVFAPTDEYAGVSEKREDIMIYDRSNLLIPFDAGFISYICGLSVTEERLLKNVSQTVQRDAIVNRNNIYELVMEFIRDSARSKQEARSKKPVQLKFDEEGNLILEDEGSDNIKIPEYVNTLIYKFRRTELSFSKDKDKTLHISNSAIFDMSRLQHDDQAALVNHVLFRAISSNRSKPEAEKVETLIVIEEAHNYAPSTTSSLCKETIKRIAQEGRKEKIHLCMITQRPRFFDQTVLSQCSNLFVFNTQLPDDVKHIIDGSAMYNEQLPSEIQGLDTGECCIIGSLFKTPLICKINKEFDSESDVRK